MLKVNIVMGSWSQIWLLVFLSNKLQLLLVVQTTSLDTLTLPACSKDSGKFGPTALV